MKKSGTGDEFLQIDLNMIIQVMVDMLVLTIV